MKPLSLLLNFPWTLATHSLSFDCARLQKQKEDYFPSIFSHELKYAFIHLSIHSTTLYCMPLCSRHRGRYQGYDSDHSLWSLFFRGSQEMIRWPELLTHTQKAWKEVGSGSTDGFIFACGNDNDVVSKHFVNNILQLKKNKTYWRREKREEIMKKCLNENIFASY